MTRKNQRHRREQRRMASERRNVLWAGLTPQEQIESLDKRGHAAMKQRARIGEGD